MRQLAASVSLSELLRLGCLSCLLHAHALRHVSKKTTKTNNQANNKANNLANNQANNQATSCLTQEFPHLRRLHSQTSAVDIMMNVERVTAGPARRRRERRLRLTLRHERVSVAMALAEKLHHSACRSVPLKEELVEHVQHKSPRGQKAASGREAEFFDVFGEELGGGRPPPEPEVAGPQARVLRHTVEPIIESFVPVSMIDVPVPQMVDQSVEVVKFFVTLPVVAEQATEVPTITLEDTIPQRAPLREPQLVEQLVEVPVPSSHCVIKETLSEVVLSRHWAADGCGWCHCSGPWGLHWWKSGVRHTQWGPPEGVTASPRRYLNTGAHAAPVPAVHGVRDHEVPQIQYIVRRCETFSFATETGIHSASCAENRRGTVVGAPVVCLARTGAHGLGSAENRGAAAVAVYRREWSL